MIFIGNDKKKLYVGSQARKVMAEPLPYDAEVEYISPVNNAYINTGVYISSDVLSGGIRYETEIEVSNPSSSTGKAEGKNQGPYFFIGTISGYWYSGYGNNWYNDKVIAVTSGFHVVKLSSLSDDRGYWIDGVKAHSYGTSYSGSTPGNFWLFRTGGGGNNFYLNAKKKWAKITVGNQVVLDAIAVRVGTSGYMYDKVSRKLMTNSGSFTPGPDKT